MASFSAEHERLLGKLLLDQEFLGRILDSETRMEALESLNVPDAEKVYDDIEDYLAEYGETLEDLVDDVDAGVIAFMG
ncbi:MAG TPA: hypothetical protein VMN57_08535 [Anaerolineales bacterium]|jgi:hypothetical protein|nr:hypothetical protein [Anaerolineales bacterium]